MKLDHLSVFFPQQAKYKLPLWETESIKTGSIPIIISLIKIMIFTQ